MARCPAAFGHKSSITGMSVRRLRSCLGLLGVARSAALKRTSGTTERSRGWISLSDSFPPIFEEFAGSRHQLWRVAQIPIRSAHIHMTEIRRQHRHASSYLLTTSIPAKQCLDGETMPEVV